MGALWQDGFVQVSRDPLNAMQAATLQEKSLIVRRDLISFP